MKMKMVGIMIIFTIICATGSLAHLKVLNNSNNYTVFRMQDNGSMYSYGNIVPNCAYGGNCVNLTNVQENNDYVVIFNISNITHARLSVDKQGEVKITHNVFEEVNDSELNVSCTDGFILRNSTGGLNGCITKSGYGYFKKVGYPNVCTYGGDCLGVNWTGG